MSVYAVICAAGAGSRMGMNKALCRLPDGETFLSSIVRTLRRCGVCHIVVVTGSDASVVIGHHSGLGVTWACNDRWETTHMLESLVCGIQKVPAGSSVIHWPADCIFIHPDDLQKLIGAPLSPLAVLCWRGNPEHPVRISSDGVEELRANASRFASLREFVESHDCTKVEMAHEALLNCNDPQSLREFLKNRE